VTRYSKCESDEMHVQFEIIMALEQNQNHFRSSMAICERNWAFWNRSSLRRQQQSFGWVQQFIVPS